MKLHLLPLLLLPLAAVADGERLPYHCDNGSRLDISFSATADGRPQAILHFADEAITLPQVPAASGALYRSEGISLHTQDDEAQFTDAKGNHRRCSRGLAPVATPASPPVASSSFLEISGSVSYRQRIALPPDAVLIIRVKKTTRSGTPALTLAEQRIELGGRQVPIPFQTTIDRDLIGKKGQVVVTARIERAGKPLFISEKPYPALSNGQAHPVDLQLQAIGRRHVR